MPLRLVIADDNELYRAGMVRAARENPGLDLVAEADGGHAALQAIVQHRPDVALLDLRMPGLDGAEVCRRALAHEPALDVRVVILSAAAEADVAEVALEAGAAAFLTKDLPRRSILQALQQVVGAGRG